jgi:NDP-hexose 3,5-(Or5-) epimerase
MEIRALSVPDSYLLVPKKLADERGEFYESFRTERLSAVLGREFRVVQANYSASRRNVVRGIHGVALPPGQAKLVTCHRGAVRDIVVDLRLGSPTFGRYHVNVLDAESGTSVYVAQGLGHGFVALTDDACIGYQLDTEHRPGTQLDIDPFDPGLALPWNTDGPAIVSAKDAAAPTVAAAAEAGLLATYTQCRDHYARLAAV